MIINIIIHNLAYCFPSSSPVLSVVFVTKLSSQKQSKTKEKKKKKLQLQRNLLILSQQYTQHLNIQGNQNFVSIKGVKSEKYKNLSVYA